MNLYDSVQLYRALAIQGLNAKTMIPLRTISRNLAKIRQGLGPERKSESVRKVKRIKSSQISNFVGFLEAE